MTLKQLRDIDPGQIFTVNSDTKPYRYIIVDKKVSHNHLKCKSRNKNDIRDKLICYIHEDEEVTMVLTREILKKAIQWVGCKEKDFNVNLKDFFCKKKDNCHKTFQIVETPKSLEYNVSLDGRKDANGIWHYKLV
ncbi:MAG: hypothetical protein GTN82_15570 [Candidatus Aminicenantes bacterium]|nr:hypothetical protein [Candidatus Aminicenantes bacterium]